MTPDLPTNAQITILRDVQTGNDDGTPTYRTDRHGPYRCWFREREPTDHRDRTLRMATVYYQPGIRPDQADLIDVQVDGQNVESGWEVLTVRDRTDHQGVHHHETTLQRVIEGR